MTRLRIAVWDPLPVYRQGLVAVLGGTNNSRYYLEEPTDLVSWAQRRERRVVLMTVESAEDWVFLKTLGRLEQKPIIVALVRELSVDIYIKALSAGAIGIIGRDAEPAVIRQAVDEAVKGRTILPATVVYALVARFGSQHEGDQPSERDIQWLRELSKGVTVAQLAEAMGYSERAMYRFLRDLYRRISVRNRTEAVLKAAQSNWI
jgi:DNA-binding NarL/FixJ family response regulator